LLPAAIRKDNRDEPLRSRTAHLRRSPGSGLDAYRFAVADQHLATAEFNDEIQFTGGPDEDFEVKGFSSLPGAEAELLAGLEDGSLEVESCTASTPGDEYAGSVGSVITETGDRLHHRHIEQSLAWDAGVLPAELKAPFVREVEPTRTATSKRTEIAGHPPAIASDGAAHREEPQMLGSKARAERRARAEADRLGDLADEYAQQAGEQPSSDRGPEPGTETGSGELAYERRQEQETNTFRTPLDLVSDAEQPHAGAGEGEGPDPDQSAGPYGTFGHEMDTDQMLAGTREGDAEDEARMGQPDLEAG